MITTMNDDTLLVSLVALRGEGLIFVLEHLIKIFILLLIA